MCVRSFEIVEMIFDFLFLTITREGKLGVAVRERMA
jgi:hypothetical protein